MKSSLQFKIGLSYLSIIAAVLIALAFLAIGEVYSAISGQTFEQSLSAMWNWIVKK